MYTLLLLALGCAQDNEFYSVPDSEGAGANTITGRVCDPDLLTWKEGAIVYTHLSDETGFIYDTRTTESDAEGYWTLSELPGDKDYEIWVQVENTIVDSFLVYLADGTDEVLPEPSCFEDLDLDVAVVSGDYDDFGGLLERIGIVSYDLVNGQTGEEILQFLQNAQSLKTYDVIFFNGGHLEEDIFYDTDGSDVDGVVPEIRTNLETFVSSGGLLYASDWSYDVIESIWPDKIDFLGDDSVPDDAQRGEVGAVRAAVGDAGMAEALGSDRVEVLYDLAVWPPVEGAAQGVTTYMTGTATWREGDTLNELPDSPLLLGFTVGQGEVIYSTYRNESNADTEVFDAMRYLLDRFQP